MNNMRPLNIILSLVIFIITGLFISTNAQVKVTDGAVLTIDPNSLLEMESANKGLLIPRMAINNLYQADPLTLPVPTGMLIYSLGGTVPDGICIPAVCSGKIKSDNSASNKIP